MTTNPPTITSSPGTEYTEADLAERAKEFPDFDWHEAAEDRAWLAAEQAKGTLDALYGKNVAVYKKRVIGVGDDYIALHLQLSRQYNVHPGRIVVVYLGE